MNLPKTLAEINLNALSHNLCEVRKKIGNKSILAVVKADAYGHGAIEISRHLLKNGVSMLGVAFTNEAIILREAGIKAPIVVFFDRDNIDAYFKYNLTPTIFDLNTAKKFSIEACKRKLEIAVHIKVDTGMGRVGFDLKNAMMSISKIALLKNIKLEGLMSHFSDAEVKDKSFATMQLKNFLHLVSSLKAKRIHFKYLHMANSAAILSMPESHLNMVRPGIMLYGYGYSEADNLKPVLSLKSRILFLKKVPPGTPISYDRTFITKRKSTIATIPIGYADGYNRKLSNYGEVIINGRRAPVIGRVCMDTIMADVTEIPNVSKNSEVVLIGRQGKEEITAQDIADRIDTIPYEVLTSIGQRIKRVYK